jgi:hypothetical protein
MNWYKLAQAYSKMYHHTSSENEFLIETHGLKIDQEWGKTIDAQADIERIYGMRPIFLTLDPNKFKGPRDVTFEVNVTGLDLVADIPSLYDKGAYYDENGMWWEEEATPFWVMDFIDDNGMIYYDDLLTPNHPLVNACIMETQTAACENSIEPSRLRLLT